MLESGSDEDGGSDSEEEDRIIAGDVVDDQEAIDKEAMERVRLYQIRKLKYYYAVATFTTEEAANNVYTECDGQEYELSGIDKSMPATLAWKRISKGKIKYCTACDHYSGNNH